MMARLRIEPRNLHGRGDEPCEVYDMPTQAGATAWWDAVTSVPCPVDGCDQTVVWYEAGYVPGYRVCMARLAGEEHTFDRDTLRHRFLAGAALGGGQTLVRDRCCETAREEDEQCDLFDGALCLDPNAAQIILELAGDRQTVSAPAV